VLGATDSGDNEVHEHIVVQGESGRLRCEMDHYAFPTIATFVEKSTIATRMGSEAGG